MANVNTMSFNDVSTLLNSLVTQATGQQALTPTTTAEFVSVGQSALKVGYDPILNAISQVLSRTIFSTRPYLAKFKGLEMDRQTFGAFTRKLYISDSEWETDTAFNLPADGQSVDMYKIKRAKVKQLNFYGANTYKLKTPTYYLTQLDNAFQNPDELAQFWNMITQNSSDMIEQAKENLCRALLSNMIAGKKAGDTNNVIHLLTEYNALTGLKLTAQTVYAPENFKPFMQWVFSRIATLSALMTERSQIFHINITDYPVERHTPYNMQRVYLYAPLKYQTEMRALADIYHDSYLTYADNETVNFWQSINSPDQINITPVYMDVTGEYKTADSPQELSNVFGVIFDKAMLGYTVINERSLPTPINADGEYWNVFHHFTARYYTDFTENAIVLLLD